MTRTYSDHEPLYLKPLKEQLCYIAIVLTVTLGLATWFLLRPSWNVLSDHKQKYDLLALQLINANKSNVATQSNVSDANASEKVVQPDLPIENKRLEVLWQQWQPYTASEVSQTDILNRLNQLVAKSNLSLKQAIWHNGKGQQQTKQLTLELKGNIDQTVEFLRAIIVLDYLLIPLSTHLSHIKPESNQVELTITLQLRANEQNGDLLRPGNKATNQRQQWLSLLARAVHQSSINTDVEHHKPQKISDCLDLEQPSLPSIVGRFQDGKKQGAIVYAPGSGVRFIEVGARLGQWQVSHISTQFILIEKADKTRCRISMQGGLL